MGLVAGRSTPETKPAEAILVEAPARLEPSGLLEAPPAGHGMTEDVGAGDEHAREPGSGRPDVVVHLPARSEPVGLVGCADLLNHVPSHCVAEVGQAVERFEGPVTGAEAAADLVGRLDDIFERPAGLGKELLLVPGAVGRGPGQADAGLVEGPLEQGQPLGADDRPAFEEDDGTCVAEGREAIEARRGPLRLVGPQPRKRLQVRVGVDGGCRGSVGAVGQEDELDVRRRVGTHRGKGGKKAIRFGMRMDADADQ